MNAKTISLLILASLLIGACAPAAAGTTEPTPLPTVVADETLIAEGRVEPAQYAEIAFNASGAVSEVLVKEGEQVKKGQALIRLGDESDTNFAAAQLELVEAQQALNDLTNSGGADLAQAVIDLKEAQEAFNRADYYLRYLQTEQKIPQTETRTVLKETARGYTREYKVRHFKGPAPKDWLIEAENDLALKKAALEEAQRAYDRLKGGVDSEQLALLEARLNAARAGVAAFTVIAPFDGVVAKLSARPGASINAGEVAVTVADISSWLIKTTDLTEIDVVALSEGQPVTVTLDAIPGATLNGAIESIGQTYEEKQGDVVYAVTVALDEGHPSLRWGMTAVVKFEK